MKIKFAVFTLSLLLVLTMSTGAFAQGVFTLSAGSEDRGRSNGHAEPTGDITLFLTTGGISAGDAGTVVIDYGVPITNTMITDLNGEVDGEPGRITVDICNATGDISNNVAIDDDDGTITIRVLGNEDDRGTTTGADAEEDDRVATVCANVGNDTASINVEGVLVSLVGTGATSVTVTVRGTGDVRLPGGTATATVISAVVDPLIDDNVNADALELIRHTGKPSSGTEFHLVITEAHNDSFDGGQLELQFSGIPEGVTVTGLDAWVTTKKLHDADPTKTAALANQVSVNMEMSRDEPAADEDGEATVFLQTRIPAVEAVPSAEPPVTGSPTGGVLSSSDIDVVVVRGMASGADDDDLLPIDLAIQVAVDLGPTGDDDELDSKGQPFFASDRTTPMTIIESTSAQTTLTAPYAIAGSGTGGGGYETGIAVSNMSSGGDAQPGAIRFDFYVGGEMMSHTTADMLEPGDTFSILLGELFQNAGSGYLIITTDFTKGDANLFISDFATFSATGTVRIKQ